MRSPEPAIIFDDSYGIWTEDDQTSVTAEVFALLDREEDGTES